MTENERCTEMNVEPKEQVEARTEPLFPPGELITSEGELVRWFQQFCVSESDLRIGIELERLGVYRENGKGVSYSGDRGLETLLTEFENSHGWLATREDGHIIQLEKEGCRINLEPGSQFEVSGGPQKDLFQVRREQREVTDLLKELSWIKGIEWIGTGVQPFSAVEEIEWVPKGRYKIMSEYFVKTGRLGHLMMKQTASIQASFNYLSEEDALFKLRLALRLSPVAAAIFANSPLSRGKLNGYLSKRSHIWGYTDPSRCGLITELMNRKGGFSDYIDYALSVPILFIMREGKWIRMEGIPFRHYLRRGSGGYRPTFADWELHLTTLFPEARLKNIVEVRSTDTQRPTLSMTVPAFWKGLLYHPGSADAACRLVENVAVEDLERLYKETPVKGLASKLGGRRIRDLAVELIGLSREGLVKQGLGEEDLLEPLEELIVERGITPAEEVIREWEAGWREDPDKFVQFHSY